ncbi:MAG: YcjF family protein, partial [Vibrio sp.]
GKQIFSQVPNEGDAPLTQDEANTPEKTKAAMDDKQRASDQTKASTDNQHDFAHAQAQVEAQMQFEAQQIFDHADDFQPIAQTQQENNELEAQFETIVRPKSKRRWLLGLGLAGFGTLLGLQAVESFSAAIAAKDWLAVGWSSFVGLGAGAGLLSLTREWVKLRRLRKQMDSQAIAADLILANGMGQGQKFCQDLAKKSGVTLEHAGYDRWHQSVQPTHNDAEVIELYDSMVLVNQDNKAKQLVATYASEAAVLVAVSPLAIADVLLVAWRNLKLIQQLGDIYGVELGYWSRVKLLKLVFVNMAAAGASELITDAGMSALSMDMAGKLSTRAAQGIGVGLLTARLGIKAIGILRPLPWREEKALRLSQVRKQITRQVTGLLKKKI